MVITIKCMIRLILTDKISYFAKICPTQVVNSDTLGVVGVTAANDL